MVLIRGFPEPLPRAVLQETLKELTDLLPSGDRAEVRSRIAPVDKQVFLIFPSAAKADGFLDTFRSEDFVYQDLETKVETLLTASKGRPLAVRRRGSATHPVYAATEPIVKMKFPTARLTQTHSMRSGTQQTEFTAVVGRKVYLLFTLHFKEDQHETTISEVRFPMSPVFNEVECQSIRDAAAPQ